MIIQFLKKARVPLTLAATCVGLILLMSLVSTLIVPLYLMIIVPLALLITPSFRELLNRFFPRLQHALSSALATVLPTMLACVIAELASPHLFLALNALPLAASLSILSLGTFISVYEYTIHLPRLELGNNYSLIKFLMNPRKIFQVIRHIITPTYPRPQRPKTAEGLRLPEADRTSLIERQTAAINELEKGAIIDDAALYKKHLSIETNRVTLANQGKTLTNIEKKMLPITIATQALEATKAEAKTLEEDYSNTLANTEQITNYQTYRELTQEMSPPYAECSITREAVWNNNPQDFVVLEKRFTGTGECVNASTRLWSFAGTYLPLFSMKGDDESTAQEPNRRDSFFDPEDESGRTADYYFYTYQVIQSHGLSLALCESIEKLNLSLRQAPVRKTAKSVSNTPTDSEPTVSSLSQANPAPSIPDYRNTAPANNHWSTSNQGVFSESRNSKLDDPSLVALELTEEEKIFLMR